MDEGKLVGKITQQPTNTNNDQQKKEIPPELKKIIDKINSTPYDENNAFSSPTGFKVPIKSLIGNQPSEAKPVSRDAEEKQAKPKQTKKETKEESPIDKYRRALKENNISEEEAIEVLIGVYYKGNYSKQYKVIGKTVTFQIAPSSYSDLKFSLLNEISPLYKQHEVAVNTELNVAAALKEFDGNVFSDNPPRQSFAEKFNFIKSLNEYVKASIFRKFIDFENMIVIVTQSEGVDDFFENARSQNI